MTVEELRDALSRFNDKYKVCVSVTVEQATRDLGDCDDEAYFDIDRVDSLNSPPHSVKISLA